MESVHVSKMSGVEQVAGAAATATKPEDPVVDAKPCAAVDSYVRRRNLFKKLWVSPLLCRAAKAMVTRPPKVIRTQKMEGASVTMRRERSKELHQLCNNLLRTSHKSKKKTVKTKNPHIISYKRKRKNTMKRRTLKAKSTHYKKAKSKKEDEDSDTDSIEVNTTLALSIGQFVDKSTAYQDLDLLDIEFGNPVYQENQGTQKSCKRKRRKRRKGKKVFVL